MKLFYSLIIQHFLFHRPAVNPPKEIVDPEDKKPEGWDEREK